MGAADTAKEIQGLVVPAVVIVGGVIVLSKILPAAGGLGGFLQQITDLWNFFLGGGGGGGTRVISFSRSPSEFLQGETVGVFISGFKPDSPVDYLWSTIGKIATFTTDNTGSYSFQFDVAYTTVPGSYTVTFDQTPYGGPKFFTYLKVLSSGMKLSTYTVRHGDSFRVTAAGLKPNHITLYGWRAPISRVAALETNEFGGFQYSDVVLETTAPGDYRLFVTQTIPGLGTGLTFEQTLKVIA